MESVTVLCSSRPLHRVVGVLASALGLAACGEGAATADSVAASPSTPTAPATPTPSATPATPAAAPATPTGLAATAGNGQVALTWSASSGAASYVVRRATASGGSYAQVGTATQTSYTDTGLANGSTYYYVVSALNGVGVSGDSAQVSSVPSAAVSVPAAPSSLSVTPGDAQVSLIWSASAGATSYVVRRATNPGGPYGLVTMPAATSYTDSGLSNGTAYYYVVAARNSAGDSPDSGERSARPVAPASAAPPSSFGTWVNVTPAGVNLTSNLSCGNYGTQSAQTDPSNPSHVYTMFMCQGIFRSTDYGATWTGPINTGSNGSTVSDCAGGITVVPNASSGGVPTLYQSCIRGAVGFWKSVDGGVNWTRYAVAPTVAINRQDYYPPVVDPYDFNHLLMAGHEMDYLVQSTNGGATWTNVALDPGMLQHIGTGAIFFLNTGVAGTTRATWLWMAQQSGGVYGTWRTTNGGTSWVRVEKNEHTHGASQIYQPDNNGIVFMTGAYSDTGRGVLRSTDYGQTWSHVGIATDETVVFGTSKNVYAMVGGPVGIGVVQNPNFQVATQPGTGTWVSPGTPAGLNQGAAQVAVLNDGSHNIFVGAMWNAGLWRYVEP